MQFVYLSNSGATIRCSWRFNIASLLRLISIIALPLLVSCSNKSSSPECITEASHTLNVEANAGCFIQKDGKLLLIRQRNKSKLSFPGGTHEKGETAQCTAHRETWEEAGLNVTVSRTLHVFDNNFHLFECTINGNVEDLKTNNTLEIIEVLWVDPQNTSSTDWRYSAQRALTIELLQQ